MPGVAIFLHVTPSENRDSILRHGLDWRRRGGGIAGGRAPERKGVFLAHDRSEAEFFVHMGRRRFAGVGYLGLSRWVTTTPGSWHMPTSCVASSTAFCVGWSRFRRHDGNFWRATCSSGCPVSIVAAAGRVNLGCR